MKKSSLFTVIIIVSSLTFVILYGLFKQKKENNGFRRKIKVDNFQINTVYKLPTSLFYFAGEPSTKIYLKDLENRTALFTIDYELSRLRKIDLKLDKDTNLQRQRINIGIANKTIYVTNNKTGDLSIIPVQTGIKSHFKNGLNTLDQSILISSSTLVGREISIKENSVQRLLTKLNYRQNRIEKEYILKKQIDGFFCTDGLLKYDSQTSKLIYVYFYRGSFVCLDTNLNVLYTNHTIDTNRIANIKLAKFNRTSASKERNLTQASPPKVVNRDFTLSDRRIYILSALKSDNESSSDFKRGQIIDVYDIITGTYINSFYIPKYKGKKLREFKVFGKTIYGIYENYLVRFSGY